MNKKKKDSQPNQSDIHTIVDLPIEAVIDYLTELSQKNYKVKVKKLSSDEATFLVKNRLNRLTVKIDTSGIIRRWNGTFTRLDAKVDIQLPKFRVILLPFICLILSLLLPVFFSRTSAYFTPILYLSFCLDLFFIAATILAAMSLEAGQMNGSKRHSEIIQNLVDDIGVKLKQKAAAIEFDGTEDNLTSLLQDEKYKHFRLGDDGEIHTP